jgi:hypothetical protein
MTLHHGLFVAGATGGVTSAKDARLALAALLSGAGVISGGAVSGNSSGPNMKYDLAVGQFVTARGSAATDGLYVFVNDGTITVDSAAPAPVSGTRWDLIWVRHKNAIDGFADDASDPILGVTVGTSGSSPTKPYGSVPAGALVLAEAQVHAGDANATSATITQVATYAGAVAADSGRQTSGGPTITPASGFSLASYSWRKVGPNLSLNITLTRTGGTITFGSSGTLADTTIATVSGAGFTPDAAEFSTFNSNASFGGAFISTGGAVQITDGHPTSVIGTGDAVKVSLHYTV